ncbi:hypothetical protein ACH5RR_031738 [Cinchona calisaya]|uniref:Uncharacterized protein n=1 Tax=Cinchona calisaya TaxID=153742 RepID=A0ABD2YHG1_9GENT
MYPRIFNPSKITKSQARVFSSRTNSWIRMMLNIANGYKINRQKTVHGAIYFSALNLTKKECVMLAFSLADERFEEILRPPTFSSSMQISSDHILKVLGGKLSFQVTIQPQKYDCSFESMYESVAGKLCPSEYGICLIQMVMFWLEEGRISISIMWDLNKNVYGKLIDTMTDDYFSFWREPETYVESLVSP